MFASMVFCIGSFGVRSVVDVVGNWRRDDAGLPKAGEVVDDSPLMDHPPTRVECKKHDLFEFESSTRRGNRAPRARLRSTDTQVHCGRVSSTITSSISS